MPPLFMRENHQLKSLSPRANCMLVQQRQYLVVGGCSKKEELYVALALMIIMVDKLYVPLRVGGGTWLEQDARRCGKCDTFMSPRFF